MDPVSMLVFNTLVQRRGINLPDIGSLRVVSTAAQIQEDGKLVPPVSRVLFSSEPGSEYDDIIQLIGDSSGKDEEQSREIYAAWRTSIQDDKGFHILSVGDIAEGVFTISPVLARTLNPSGTALVQLKRQFSLQQIFFWVAVTVVVGGGLAAGLITYLNSRPSPYDAPYADIIPMSAPSDSSHLSTPQNSEVTLDAMTETDREVQKTDSSPITAPSDNRSVVSSKSPGSKVSPAPSVQTPSRTAAPTPAAPASPAPKKEPVSTPAPQQGELRYYVVVGTYSTDANAERFIASARRKDATQNYRKLPLSNGKIMVYTSDTAREAEAQQQRRALSGTFPDAWVFKRRVQ